MLFSITVYKEMGNRKKMLYLKEVQARDGIQALEKVGVRFQPGKIIEIRTSETPIDRPVVNRVERDGVM